MDYDQEIEKRHHPENFEPLNDEDEELEEVEMIERVTGVKVNVKVIRPEDIGFETKPVPDKPKVATITKGTFMDWLDQPKNRKQLSALCSFLIPGAGQLLNAIRNESSKDLIKAILVFIGTIIGSLFLVLPGIAVWIYGMVDAYRNAIPRE